MRRVTLAALILTATALVGGATWAAGTHGPGEPVWSEAAPVPKQLLAASPGSTATQRSAPTPGSAAARKVTTAPVSTAAFIPAPGREEEATKALPHNHGNPPPFVQEFAAQPGVARQKPRSRPTAPIKVAPTIDGCDRNYGTIAQCIPIAFPKGVTDKCGWLTAHGFTALKVVGKDHQSLDPDRDGIACG